MIKIILITCVFIFGCSPNDTLAPSNSNEKETQVQRQNKPEWGAVSSNGLQMSSWMNKNIVYCLVRNGTDHPIDYTAGTGGIGWWEWTKVYVRNSDSKEWFELRLLPTKELRTRLGAITRDQKRTLESGEEIVGKKRFGKNHVQLPEAILNTVIINTEIPYTFTVDLSEYEFPKELVGEIEVKIINSAVESPAFNLR